MSESEFSLSDDDKDDNEDGNITDNDKEVNLKGNDIQQKKKIASQKLIVTDAEKDQTEPVTALDGMGYLEKNILVFDYVSVHVCVYTCIRVCMCVFQLDL